MNKFVLHSDVRSTAIEEDGVVLHLGSRRYFTVNGSGRVLLEALAAPRTFDDLVALLLAKYEVTAEQAAASVKAFLARCGDAGLVREERL